MTTSARALQPSSQKRENHTQNAGLYLIYCMRPYGKNAAVPEEKPMTALPTYDIFKRRGENLVWVEAVSDLDTANARINELQKSSDEEYVVFDQKNQQIVTVTLPQ
jgi:hypothetical protein